MEIESLIARLLASRGPLPNKLATRSHGIYALWLDPEAFGLLGIDPGPHDIAYVGVAANRSGLAGRFREEWRPRHSGRSSPRRTLGALLVDELGLRPRPRPGSGHPRDADYFVFGDEGERVLLDWIVTYGAFAYVELPASDLAPGIPVEHVETNLIRALCPPLNISKWDNPAAPRLKQARQAAKDAAATLTATRHPSERLSK